MVWSHDRIGFIERIDHFLGMARRHGLRVLLVLFDDCHRSDPAQGAQTLPVPGVHNSGWQQSPGRKLVLSFHDGTVAETEKTRLAEYVQSVLTRFADDERILMWDVYNEPGQSGYGDKTNELLQLAWQWARIVNSSQPLTVCLEGSGGEKNIALDQAQSDVITFHCYESHLLEEIIIRHKARHPGRPVVCTEYMAREMGTTFQHSLPIFRKHQVGCFCWGLVAGKSQTHFNWKTVEGLARLKAQGSVLKTGDAIPEPALWFHDIFRIDGTPFDKREINFIRELTSMRLNY